MPFVALAGVGFVGEALMALGFLVGVLLMAYLIEKFGGYIPYIGAWLASKAEGFLSYAVLQLSSTFSAALWALTNLVDVTVTVVTYPMARVRDFTLATAGALWWVKYAAIPNAINIAINWAAAGISAGYTYSLNLFYQGRAELQTAYNSSIAFARSVLTAAYAFTAQEATVAFNYALTLYYGALAYIDVRYQAAIGLSYSVFHAVEADLSTLRDTMYSALGLVAQGLEADLVNLDVRLTALIEQYAAAAERDAIHLVDVASSAALTTVWPDLVTDVDGILAEVPDILTDIRTDLASIPRAIPTGLLDALVGLGAISVPLLRYLKECGVPMCRDLHGLMDLLGDLADVATDAALLGLIAESVHDPRAAAHELSTVAGPLVRDAQSLITSLIGL